MARPSRASRGPRQEAAAARPAKGTPAISVEVLGPVRLLVDGAPVDVPGEKRRAVLALLALAGGRPVSVDELIDALWPSEAPAEARAALQSHVSRLRGHLGRERSRLQATSGGYRLQLEPSELDVGRVRARLERARPLLGRDPARAAAELREARSAWRGRALADVTGVAALAARAVVLDELQRDVDDLYVEAALAAGDAASAAEVATASLAAEPLREQAVLLAMRALAERGRVAEALRTGYELRRRLREEAGLDPSPALDALERELASRRGPALAGPRPGQVPVPLTPLVGRESEVAALQRLLATDRLVTVVGPGGVGKTRLALDVARRHDDAVFVALAPVTEPAALPHALAAALGLEAVPGDPLPTCAALLASGPRLLVVDNCEHLLPAARELVLTLLERCPPLHVLTTSRERLALAAERQVRLGPLALPDERAEHPERSPAVMVFLERSRRARPDFEPTGDELGLIADIVRRLDGLPLSIELAAGRLSSLTLADLHQRLDRALDLLDAGPAPGGRLHTLRSTIEWSYALLAEHEQRLFRHLAVFPDGVDLRTAELVAADLALPGDVTAALARLVDASMLHADLDGEARYRMLETVRAYALDRLMAEGEATAASARLVAWAVDLASWVDESLHTAAEPVVNGRLRRELPNLRAAWQEARRAATIDDAIAIAVALDDAAQWRDLPELWQWACDLGNDERVLTHPRAAAALATASDAAWLLGRLEQAAALAEQAMSLARDDEGTWRALLALAVVDLSRAQFDRAVERALASAARCPRPAHGHWIAALASAYAGDLERADELLAEHAPASPTPQAEQAYVAGELASIRGQVEEAEAHYARAIELAREVGATFVVGIATVGLLTVRAAAGRHVEALEGYRDVLAYWERAGNWIQLWTTLRNLAALLRSLGDTASAAFLEAAADRAPDASVVGPSVWGANVSGADGSDVAAAEVGETLPDTSPQQVLEQARAAIEGCLRRLGV